MKEKAAPDRQAQCATDYDLWYFDMEAASDVSSKPEHLRHMLLHYGGLRKTRRLDQIPRSQAAKPRRT